MALGKESLVGGSIFKGFTNYPRCRLFNCPRSRSVSYRCCAYCEKNEKCQSKCLNSPDRCGVCVMPGEEGGETDEI